MSTPSRPVSRYQRRILAWGAGAACVLYVVGAPLYLDRVEADLTERVSAELDAAGFDGVAVSFAGQTGSLECTAPLGDPRAALDVVYAVRGVRDVAELPDACRVRAADDAAIAAPGAAATTFPDDTAADASTTTTAVPEVDFASVLDVLAGSPQFSLLDQLVRDADLRALFDDGPVTLFAPTNAAFDELTADAVAQLRSDPDLLARVLRHHVVAGRLLTTDFEPGVLTTFAGDLIDVVAVGRSWRVGGASLVEPDLIAANGVVHAVDALLLPDDVDLTTPDRPAPTRLSFGAGGYRLEGVVRSELERTVLVTAAAGAVGADAVDDALVVDPDLGLPEATAETLAALLPVVADGLVSATIAFDGERVEITGTYADDDGRTSVEQAAAAVGAETTLTEPPAATPDDAADLEAGLNEFVAANPVLFEPSSSVLDETAAAVLDEVARRILGFTGVSVTVEGHTDSDGSAQANLILSEARAAAVRQGLVDRGVDPDAVVAEGFGSTRPVLVDGVEDKDASRRVEFRVVVA